MATKININTHAAVIFTNKLEKLRRSALPNAVRGALNGAAFDVKQNTMPSQAHKKFVVRAPNFFKANSRVEKAMGWDINSMRATVGFTPGKGKGADLAVKDLEEQEKGGTIERRSYIPTREARGGGNTKKVRPSMRLTSIKNIVNSNTIAGSSPKQKFRYAAVKAGRGGFVLGNNTKKTLFRIDSISTTAIKKKPVYSYKPGRSVKVGASGFMKSATLESADKIEQLYIKEAKRQIDRV